MWLADEERAEAKRIMEEEERNPKPRSKRARLEDGEIRIGERVECWTPTGIVTLRRES